MFSVTLVALSLLPLSSESILKEVIRLISVLVIELIVYSSFRGLKSTINALRLMVFFVLLGLAVYFMSMFFKWAPLSPLNILIGSIQLVVLFIALSMFLQLISVKEWRRILGLLGFKNYSLKFSLVLSQIPVIIYYASEAFTTTRLKYGAKKLYKFVIPLILLTIATSRSTLEAYMIYGTSLESNLSICKSKDWILYTLVAICIAIFIFLYMAN